MRLFTEKQRNFINRVCKKTFDFLNLSDDDYVEIESKIGDYLVLHCLGNQYEPNSDGILCESILDEID